VNRNESVRPRECLGHETRQLSPAKRPVRIPKGERGQLLYMVAAMTMAMFGVTAMVVDVGRVFIAYHELQASTDAAALAGGEALGQPGSTAATTDAAVALYSSTSSNKNAFPNLPAVTTTPTLKCLTTLADNGIPCYGAGSYNAIQVAQTVTLPTTFAAVIGTPSVPLTATATAAMAGSATTPYNVAIIVDTTSSMSDPDSGSDCSGTRLSCALGGVATLLGELFPCASEATTCTVSNDVATNAVDQVALFTFPNITTSTTVDDTACPSSNPTTEDTYTFPSPTLSAGVPNVTFTPTGKTAVTMTYQITNGLGDQNGFLSNYRTSDTASSLNASSALAIAAGKGSCAGISDPGGAGTYYAGVIYAAADALLAEQAKTPSAVPVIILISDGDASSTEKQMAGGSGAKGADTGTGAINASATGVSGTYPYYPSWNQECAQAVQAALAVQANPTLQAAGFRFYSVAYGAESSGCATDTSGTYKNISPCQTMKDMASSPAYFFSDYAQSGGGTDTSCAGSGSSTTSINQIFTDIFTSFSVARLIPNGTS